jgi:hypothetical protein
MTRLDLPEHFNGIDNDLWDSNDPTEAPRSLDDNRCETCWGAYILDREDRLIGSAVGTILPGLKGERVGEVSWLTIHRQWRRTEERESLCRPFFEFVLRRLSRHCRWVHLDNAAGKTGCYCYLRAALRLGSTVYFDGIGMKRGFSGVGECLEIDDLEDQKMVIEFDRISPTR